MRTNVGNGGNSRGAVRRASWADRGTKQPDDRGDDALDAPHR